MQKTKPSVSINLKPVQSSAGSPLPASKNQASFGQLRARSLPPGKCNQLRALPYSTPRSLQPCNLSAPKHFLAVSARASSRPARDSPFFILVTGVASLAPASVGFNELGYITVPTKATETCLPPRTTPHPAFSQEAPGLAYPGSPSSLVQPAQRRALNEPLGRRQNGILFGPVSTLWVIKAFMCL